MSERRIEWLSPAGHARLSDESETTAQVLLSERDAAIAERDRLRRELEALRDEMREWCHGLDAAACHRAVLYGPTIDRIDSILSGG